MKLDLGSKVRSADGKVLGKIDRIVLQTQFMTVREFVIHKGVFLGHNRFVPIHLVDRVDSDGTAHLRMSAREANELPEFLEEQHMPVYGGTLQWTSGIQVITQPGSVPRDAVILSHRTQVFDQHARYVGYLDKVEYAADGSVSHIILDSGDNLLWEMRMPIQSIASIRHDRIVLHDVTVEVTELTSPSQDQQGAG